MPYKNGSSEATIAGRSYCWGENAHLYRLTNTIWDAARTVVGIGRFSEAGLHKWMPFVIFHARSHKRLQLSLPGQFLSRRWFMLCITIEVELELWSSTNATAVADAKITGERWWRVEKCVFTLFFGWPENREFAERMWFWASYSMSNKLLLVARHILTSGLQKCL